MINLPTALSASLFALALPFASIAHADVPRVITSVKPVQGIVAAIMEGVGEPSLLIDGIATPHGFSLKPSQASRLQDADLVFWIGPSLETFLVKPLQTIADTAKSIALIDSEGVTTLPLRTLEEVGENDHDHDHGHDHETEGADPHIWLDPENAIAMAKAIASRLQAEDPDNAETYAANAANFESEIKALSADLDSTLSSADGKQFLVFHDAYQYLENRYGLQPAGAVAISPEQTPGARHLAELKASIEAENVQCILSEVQFPDGFRAVLTEGSNIRTATIDPLGGAVEPGPGHYPEMMRAMATTMAECLGVKATQ